MAIWSGSDLFCQIVVSCLKGHFGGWSSFPSFCHFQSGWICKIPLMILQILMSSSFAGLNRKHKSYTTSTIGNDEMLLYNYRSSAHAFWELTRHTKLPYLLLLWPQGYPQSTKHSTAKQHQYECRDKPWRGYMLFCSRLKPRPMQEVTFSWSSPALKNYHNTQN